MTEPTEAEAKTAAEAAKVIAGTPMASNPIVQSLIDQMETVYDLKAADHARLMADNERLLKTARANDAEHREFTRGLRDHFAKELNMDVASGDSARSSDEVDGEADTDIRIRSPEVHNHYYPDSASQPEKRNGFGKFVKAALIGAGLLTAGGGLGAGIGLISTLLSREPPAQSPSLQPDSDTQYRLGGGGWRE